MSTQSKFLNKRGVGVRYGNRALRTIERWVRSGVLPPPDQVINQRWYWNETTLDAHDRQRTVDAANQRSGAPRMTRASSDTS